MSVYDNMDYLYKTYALSVLIGMLVIPVPAMFKNINESKGRYFKSSSVKLENATSKYTMLVFFQWFKRVNVAMRYVQLL